METITPRHGCLTLFGWGCKLRVDSGHLYASWGIADKRYEARIPRASGALERLIIIGAEGYVTFKVLRWCQDQGVSIIFLKRDGSLTSVVSPGRPADAKLRRAQWEATHDGKGLELSRELIARKLEGQESLVRNRLKEAAAAARIAGFADRLDNAETLDAIRSIEAVAARVYWGELASLPVRFPRRDQTHVAERWLKFGSRIRGLSTGPQKAITPANAALNYLNMVALAEASVGLSALGMDPSVGYLHLDIPNRDSLACDVVETIRPDVEGWLLDWLMGKVLSREWFHELPDGECRLSLALCRELSGTARLWRAKVAPVCEWLAEVLANRRATPLTKRRIREAHGGGPAPLDRGPRLPTFCQECGAGVQSPRTYCFSCALVHNAERIRKLSASGRAAASKPEATARIKETSRRQQVAIVQWDPRMLPKWLTVETYETRVRPELRSIPVSVIARECGVTHRYVRMILRGERRPHKRHFEKLAALAGVKEMHSPAG